MNFLSVELVEKIHARSIHLHGGSPGLRDRGLLESAFSRAENKAHYEPDASVAVVAASLAWGLIKNHAFIDGNKRVGFGALGVFLEINHHALTCSKAEELDMVLMAAAGQISEEQWTQWIVRIVVPVT